MIARRVERRSRAHEQAVRQAEREREWVLSRSQRADEQLQSLEGRRRDLADACARDRNVRSSWIRHWRQLRQELQAVDDETLRRRVAELETRTAVAERTVSSRVRAASRAIAPIWPTSPSRSRTRQPRWNSSTWIPVIARGHCGSTPTEPG